MTLTLVKEFDDQKSVDGFICREFSYLVKKKGLSEKGDNSCISLCFFDL